MPRTPDLAGRVLDDRYELHDLIGEGTFGRVYRGHDRRLRRAVAIKVIKPWWADDPAWVERFEREAQLLARVSDPGIVQIFDVGQSEEWVYYVAELVDGESLAERLRRGRLAPAQAARIAEELCRALAHAHAERVVHRDVKPANILIDRSGRVKVGDFGVARLADGSPHGAAATALGSPRYMSPEQASGKPTSAASDVYGVGVVLYEMLAGEPPFAGEAAVEVAVRHLQDPPPPLPESVPAGLTAIVYRALSKDPAVRYPDGGAMAQALADARAKLPAGEDHDGDALTQVVPSLAPDLAPTSVLAGPAAATSLAATSVVPPADATQVVAPAGAPQDPPADATHVAPADATHVASRADATQVAPRRTPPGPPPRRRLLWPLLLGAGLIAVVAIVLLSRKPETTVPELRGLSREGVRARAGRNELEPRFEKRYSTSTPKGRSLAQDPDPGARVNEGSTVRVTLSDGPAPVPVPDVKGDDLDEARQELDAVGLRSSVREEAATGEPGTVLRQSPAPPKRAVPGSTVKLTVVREPRWNTVTSFEGVEEGESVPFRIRGERWRVVYDVVYEGRCALLVVCFGPAAELLRLPAEEHVDDWDLDKGTGKTREFETDPGVYQITVVPGDDAARWSMRVQDFY